MYHAVAIVSPATSPRGDREPDEAFYTLAFPAPDRSSLAHGRRISFGAACDVLRAAAPVDPRGNGAADEQRAMAELRRAWTAKFRAPPPIASDSVATPLLRELLRELVVSRFEAIAGLEVATTVIPGPDGAVLVHLRPSAALLAATAERLRLPVPVMQEVDPGERYWTPEGSARERERQVWDRAAAQEELYRLFLAGKIPAEDARVFDEDEGEDMGMWSRRLHALQRFSDPTVAAIVQPGPSAVDEMLPPEVEAVAYLPFVNRASLQYLYRQIDGAASPFRVVDKIRLTRAIVDEQFNMDALVTSGTMLGHFCLHSHRTDAIDTSIDALRAQWGGLLGPWRFLRRHYELSRPTATQLLALAWRLPAFQPVQHVRNYFGEQIALYFSFASNYALALQSLVALSLLLALPSWDWQAAAARPEPSLSTDRLCLLAFAAANCAIARVFERKWALRERKLAAAWGSDLDSAVSSHDRRAQFRGQLRRSAIDHRLAPYYSPRQRLAKQIVTSCALAALVTALLSAYLLLVTSRRFQTFATASRVNVSMANVLIAAVARCLASPALTWAVQVLVNWENHETHESHDASLTLKYALAQSVNVFGVLWYMAFVRSSPDDCGKATAGLSCREQAADLLVVALALDLTLALLHLPLSIANSGLVAVFRGCSSCWRRGSRRPSARGYVAHSGRTRRGSRTALDASRSPLKASQCQQSSSSAPTPSSLEEEPSLPAYKGVLGAYARLVLPFGYVAGFAALAPLSTTAFAWATTLAHLRLDAFTLTHRVQRPFPHPRTTIGRWRAVLELFSLASAALNASFVAQAIANVDSDADFDLTAANARAAGTRLAVFAGFALLWWLLGLQDHWDRVDERQLARVTSRREFLRRKYLSNIGSSRPVDLSALLPVSGRVFLNGVFRYLVTGDKQEEDAAEELRDQCRGQQRRALEVEKRIAELRARFGSGSSSATRFGSLYVEILGVNVLPPGVDAFVELQAVRSHRRGRRGRSRSDDDDDVSSGPEAADGECFNTSVAKRVAGRPPQWRETFELPLESLEHALELRVVDAAAPILGPKRGRKRLGVARLSIVDIVERCVGIGASPDSPSRVAAGSVSSASGSPKQRARPSMSAVVKLPTAGASPRGPQPPPSPSASPATVEVPMASYELPLDASDALLAAIRRHQADLTASASALRHGHPRLALRCGVRLEELGSLLVAQRRQRRRLVELRARESQFLSWEADKEG